MDYVMYRGDSLMLDLAITQKNNNVVVPVDLTGATLWMTAKYKITDTDASAVFQITTPTDIKIDEDPLSGRATVIVPGSATLSVTYPPDSESVRLIYDIQVKTQTGIVQTVARGYLTVMEDVTIAEIT